MPDHVDHDMIIKKSEKTAAEIKEQKDSEIPQYRTQLDLSDDQKERLKDEVFDEFEAIKAERQEAGLENKWRALDNQYAGKLDENPDQQFNLHKQTTKIKVDGVTRRIKKAFLKSDPRYVITPRPEFAKQGGYDTCQKQTDFLDYKLDVEIPMKKAKGQIIHSSVLKGTGMEKIEHIIKREPRKREESYKGDPKPKLDEFGAPVISKQDKLPVIENKGLKEFIKAHPLEEDATEGKKKVFESRVKRLMEGKELNLVVEYKETTYDDPMPSCVNLQNFYVRLATEGYEGLKSTKLTIERLNFSWWELKKKEIKGDFFDIDELKLEGAKLKDSKKESKDKKNFANDTYDILECVYYFKLEEDKDDEDEEEEIKVVCWIAEERKVVIGAINFPFYGIECYYNPHYIKDNKSGFYQDGIGEDLTDSNIAENALLNFTLEGAYVSNIVTPIVEEGSDIAKQFLNKTWTHGLPITKKKNESAPDFLSKYMKPFNTTELLNLLLFLAKGDDDISGVSSLMTGRESPTDPTAPASKTIALLRESGISIEDYILAMLPAFNETANIILQIYHQISRGNKKYLRKAKMVVGEDPFEEISRTEMVTRTTIQSQAAAFNFDKMNEKQEDVALYSMLRQELLIARNPDAVYTLLKNIIRGWSPKWKNLIDQILPPLDKFKKDQQMLVFNAVAQYVEAVLKQSKITKEEPEFDPKALITMANEVLAMSVTPPDEKAVKAQEKANE